MFTCVFSNISFKESPYLMTFIDVEFCVMERWIISQIAHISWVIFVLNFLYENFLKIYAHREDFLIF